MVRISAVKAFKAGKTVRQAIREAESKSGGRATQAAIEEATTAKTPTAVQPSQPQPTTPAPDQQTPVASDPNAVKAAERFIPKESIREARYTASGQLRVTTTTGSVSYYNPQQPQTGTPEAVKRQAEITRETRSFSKLDRPETPREVREYVGASGEKAVTVIDLRTGTVQNVPTRTPAGEPSPTFRYTILPGRIAKEDVPRDEGEELRGVTAGEYIRAQRAQYGATESLFLFYKPGISREEWRAMEQEGLTNYQISQEAKNRFAVVSRPVEINIYKPQEQPVRNGLRTGDDRQADSVDPLGVLARVQSTQELLGKAPEKVIGTFENIFITSRLGGEAHGFTEFFISPVRGLGKILYQPNYAPLRNPLTGEVLERQPIPVVQQHVDRFFKVEGPLWADPDVQSAGIAVGAGVGFVLAPTLLSAASVVVAGKEVYDLYKEPPELGEGRIGQAIPILLGGAAGGAYLFHKLKGSNVVVGLQAEEIAAAEIFGKRSLKGKGTGLEIVKSPKETIEAFERGRIPKVEKRVGERFVTLTREQALEVPFVRKQDITAVHISGASLPSETQVMASAEFTPRQIASVRARQRGTALIETDKGILVVKEPGRPFRLPGGEVEARESLTRGITRELFEETRLKTLRANYLFEYVGKPEPAFKGGFFRDVYQVIKVETKGVPVPSAEVRKIAYYTPGSRIPLSPTTRELITKYYSLKKTGALSKEQRFGRVPTPDEVALQDPVLYVSPLRYAQKYFLGLDNIYGYGTSVQFSMLPTFERPPQPTITFFKNIKEVKRQPRDVLLQRGYEATRKYLRTQAGKRTIFITKRSEAAFDPVIARTVGKKFGVLGGTTEPEAGIVETTRLDRIFPEGIIARLKGYKYFTTIDDKRIPIYEYNIGGRRVLRANIPESGVTPTTTTVKEQRAIREEIKQRGQETERYRSSSYKRTVSPQYVPVESERPIRRVLEESSVQSRPVSRRSSGSRSQSIFERGRASIRERLLRGSSRGLPTQYRSSLRDSSRSGRGYSASSSQVYDARTPRSYRYSFKPTKVRPPYRPPDERERRMPRSKSLPKLRPPKEVYKPSLLALVTKRRGTPRAAVAEAGLALRVIPTKKKEKSLLQSIFGKKR